MSRPTEAGPDGQFADPPLIFEGRSEFPSGSTDVLIVPQGDGVGAPDEWQSKPVPKGPVSLGGDLVAGCLAEALAERAMDACEERGENHNPRRQFGQRYAFVRHPAPTSDLNWDEDGRIWEAIALSRLVHSTAVCTPYAARVRVFKGHTDITPLSITSRARYLAWVFDPLGREWLDRSELATLRMLHWHYRCGGALPERVSYATFAHEMAARTYHLELRWGIVTSGLESLLKVGRNRATRQFCGRVPQLAAAVGVAGVDASFARDFYERRSELVHGNRAAFQANYLGGGVDLDLAERVLRATLRRALCDHGFRRHFATDASVEATFPI